MRTLGTRPLPIAGAGRRELRTRSLAGGHLLRACCAARDELAWERIEPAACDEATIERASGLVEVALRLCREALGIYQTKAMTDREAASEPARTRRKADPLNGQDTPRRG